ncbi:unnamed protein product [Meloidogyne enterolobii]|uniref:Uncharacterized protein n=1 Tax=Meloidogyne enterolobii TaxID=390850 RepID=A0ACB1AJR6_MELEN
MCVNLSRSCFRRLASSINCSTVSPPRSASLPNITITVSTSDESTTSLNFLITSFNCPPSFPRK